MKKSVIMRAIHGRVDVHIGKAGITENVLKEIKRRLKSKKVVKIKILRSARKTIGIDRKEIAKIIAEKTGSEIIDVRGYTFVLKIMDRSSR